MAPRFPKGHSPKVSTGPKIDQQVTQFGYQRIAEQTAHAFGVDINRDVRTPGPGEALSRPIPGILWSLLADFPCAHTKDSLWSVDLFRGESILLRSHWVLVVIDVYTRRFIGFGIRGEFIDGATVCRLFHQAIAGQTRPRRISTDHDPPFRFHRWLANLRILEIDEIKSVPHAPMRIPSSSD